MWHFHSIHFDFVWLVLSCKSIFICLQWQKLVEFFFYRWSLFWSFFGWNKIQYLSYRFYIITLFLLRPFLLLCVSKNSTTTINKWRKNTSSSWNVCRPEKAAKLSDKDCSRNVSKIKKRQHKKKYWERTRARERERERQNSSLCFPCDIGNNIWKSTVTFFCCFQIY